MAKEAQQQRQQLDSVTDYVQQLEVSSHMEQDLKAVGVLVNCYVSNS